MVQVSLMQKSQNPFLQVFPEARTPSLLLIWRFLPLFTLFPLIHKGSSSRKNWLHWRGKWTVIKEDCWDWLRLLTNRLNLLGSRWWKLTQVIACCWWLKAILQFAREFQGFPHSTLCLWCYKAQCLWCYKARDQEQSCSLQLGNISSHTGSQ